MKAGAKVVAKADLWVVNLAASLDQPLVASLAASLDQLLVGAKVAMKVSKRDAKLAMQRAASKVARKAVM